MASEGPVDWALPCIAGLDSDFNEFRSAPSLLHPPVGDFRLFSAARRTYCSGQQACILRQPPPLATVPDKGAASTASSASLRMIELSPKRVARFFGTVIAVLAALHVATLYVRHIVGEPYAMGFVPLFHMAEEANIPTAFTMLLFVLSAVGFYSLHLGLGSRGDGKHWLVLAGVFLFLGFDEAGHIHEITIEPFRRLGATGVLYYAWVIPYGFATALLAAYVGPRILRLQPEIRRFFIAAAVIYITGAMGMEFIEGYFAGQGTVIITIAIWIEESFEMIGLSTLLYAQMKLLQAEGVEVGIRIPK